MDGTVFPPRYPSPNEERKYPSYSPFPDGETTLAPMPSLYTSTSLIGRLIALLSIPSSPPSTPSFSSFLSSSSCSYSSSTSSSSLFHTPPMSPSPLWELPILPLLPLPLRPNLPPVPFYSSTVMVSYAAYRNRTVHHIILDG